MSQTLSSPAANPAPIGYPARNLKQPGDLSVRGRRVTRARKPAPAGVPMLDWPSDLFGDNATVDELASVDFLMRCDADAGQTRH